MQSLEPRALLLLSPSFPLICVRIDCAQPSPWRPSLPSLPVSSFPNRILGGRGLVGTSAPCPHPHGQLLCPSWPVAGCNPRTPGQTPTWPCVLCSHMHSWRPEGCGGVMVHATTKGGDACRSPSPCSTSGFQPDLRSFSTPARLASRAWNHSRHGQAHASTTQYARRGWGERSHKESTTGRCHDAIHSPYPHRIY